jgi:hypothetical protein
MTNCSFKIITAVLLLLHALVFAAGALRHALAVWLAAANVISAGILIAFWIRRRMLYAPANTERREIMGLLAELVAGASAGWFLLQWPLYGHLRNAQYAVFIFHSLLLVAAIVFAWLFRLKKLF